MYTDVDKGKCENWRRGPRSQQECLRLPGLDTRAFRSSCICGKGQFSSINNHYSVALSSQGDLPQPVSREPFSEPSTGQYLDVDTFPHIIIMITNHVSGAILIAFSVLTHFIFTMTSGTGAHEEAGR